MLRAPRSLMLRVPPSRFRMGSSPTEVIEAVALCAREPFSHLCNEELFSNEQPVHAVKLSSFWLDRTEVSVAAYRRCAELGRCPPVRYSQGAKRFDRDDLPASFVSFEQAEAYCKFRGARLPTEAEFERAARGIQRRRFPWGDLYNSRASNHGRFGLDVTDKRDGYAELAPVGSFPAGRTPEGFLDLAGNAAEWVADRYAPGYPEGEQVDPKGPQNPTVSPLPGRTGIPIPLSNARVIRGGHFGRGGAWLRGAARDAREASTKGPHIGFRCARADQRKGR